MTKVKNHFYISAEPISISTEDFKIYTTKNGSPWQNSDISHLDNCILQATLETAVEFADANFCTILCVSGNAIIWSGGPIKAKEQVLALKHNLSTKQ